MDGSITTNLPNPWRRISEVAQRLGVKPRSGPAGTIVATGADGQQYDVWEVAIAFLDRMDAVSKDR